MNSARFLACSTSQRQALGQGAGGECDAERRKSASREYGFPRQRFATNGPLAASVLERIEFSNDSTCEGDGGEFKSPRRGEETRGRQLAAREDNPCKQYIAVHTRHTRKHFFACGSGRAHASQPALLCVISQNSHLHKHISRRTRNVHGLTAFFFHRRTALHLCFVC